MAGRPQVLRERGEESRRDEEAESIVHPIIASANRALTRRVLSRHRAAGYSAAVRNRRRQRADAVAVVTAPASALVLAAAV
jgi:hypothetical protein